MVSWPQTTEEAPPSCSPTTLPPMLLGLRLGPEEATMASPWRGLFGGPAFELGVLVVEEVAGLGHSAARVQLDHSVGILCLPPSPMR